MTEQIAAYSVVAIAVAIFIGALGMMLLAAHDLRRITRRGIRNR